MRCTTDLTLNARNFHRRFNTMTLVLLARKGNILLYTNCSESK